MLSALPYKTKQFFFVLIKLSIVFGAAYFIYVKFTTNDNIDFYAFIDVLAKTDAFSTKNILFLLFLTSFNWIYEVLKWKNLISLVKQISFLEALKQSLAALTASLFTPNRIGDYGAKAIYYKRPLRKRILFLNLISNMAQMSVTLVFGIVGFSLFITKYNVAISYFNLFRYITLVVIIISVLAVGISYNKFNIRGFLMARIKTFTKNIPSKIHFKNGLFSVIRYLIFSFQFYYLLLIFGTELSYYEAMIIITSMYLFVSVIPTIFVFDVIVKGSVALYLFNFAGVDNLTILSITMLMWLLNFVLPSVFGSFYVLNFDFQKNLDPNPNTKV